MTDDKTVSAEDVLAYALAQALEPKRDDIVQYAGDALKWMQVAQMAQELLDKQAKTFSVRTEYDDRGSAAL